jgi:hypothetical protein
MKMIHLSGISTAPNKSYGGQFWCGCWKPHQFMSYRGWAWRFNNGVSSSWWSHEYLTTSFLHRGSS